MVNWKKMKMKMKNISSANQQLSVSGKTTGINAFQSIKNVYPLSLKENHQIFPILTTCHFFFTWEPFFCRETHDQSYCMEIWAGMLESISLEIISGWNNKFSHWTLISLEKVGATKWKQMGSNKIKENHNRGKPKKMKETAKRSKEGDQRSPSEKKECKMPR